VAINERPLIPCHTSVLFTTLSPTQGNPPLNCPLFGCSAHCVQKHLIECPQHTLADPLVRCNRTPWTRLHPATSQSSCADSQCSSRCTMVATCPLVVGGSLDYISKPHPTNDDQVGTSFNRLPNILLLYYHHPIVFVRVAAPAAVHHLTTMHGEWYHLRNTLTFSLLTTCVLPTKPKALGEVAATMRESRTVFSVTRGNAMAQHACS
jgi:hypothetical protein